MIRTGKNSVFHTRLFLTGIDRFKRLFLLMFSAYLTAICFGFFNNYG